MRSNPAAGRTTTGVAMAAKEMSGRVTAATTSAAPIQRTTVTIAASSPVSWNVRSQRPVASRTCRPIPNVNSVAASHVPIVRRTIRIISRRLRTLFGGAAYNRSVLQRLKQWAREIKLDVVAIGIAARDPRVPWYVKLLAATVATYALSPIDLIPDFVPVLGYVDDLIIVPAGILLTVRLMPVGLMEEFRAEAAMREARRTSRVGAAFVVVVWVSALAIVTWWMSTR